MSQVTVVGGGMAGLTAAICAAEEGAEVDLHESRSQLGGRARSAAGPRKTNFGPHAAYPSLPMWRWLDERDLLPPLAPPIRRGIKLRVDGRLRGGTPLLLLKAGRHRRKQAPADLSFRDWASIELGEQTAEALCGMAGAFTFDYDPGRLSAQFVWDRLRGIYMPPQVRFIEGGWTQLVDGLEKRARHLGVRIHLSSRVEALPAPPVIVATELADAASLLGDNSLRWTGTRTVLIDAALSPKRRDPAAVFDCDNRALIERYTAADRTLAPPGEELVQAHVGIRPHEDVDEATARLHEGFETAFPDWRAREVWSRRQVIENRAGALDLPGTTWRDRPQIQRRGGVFVAGDMMAAPGILSEVAVASGRAAAQGALRWRAPDTRTG